MAVPTVVSMGEVDPDFIQALEHRPNFEKVDVESVPLIDLTSLNLPPDDSNSDAKARLVEEIGDACKNWGFFQVVNHGVAVGRRRRLEKAAREFFAQPKEEKRKVRRNEENFLGYFDTELTKNVRDWKEVFDFRVGIPMLFPVSPEPGDDEVRELITQWPLYPPDLREACEEYVEEVQNLSFKLLELISLSLGLSESRLYGYFKNHTAFARLNHYPPCPFSHLALGVGRHKDGGALTVLAQDDVGGLEVKRKSDGEWIPAKPIPNAFIVNVGDIIQVWSNDKYESVEHRVTVNSERERFSIPFFLNPAINAVIQPLEELTSQQNPAKYKPFVWGKFFANRRQSNFKKRNAENLQIFHFKI